MKRDYFTKLSLGSLLCLLIISAGCCINIGCWPKAKYERTEQLSAPLAIDSTVAAETDIGSITVTGADVNDCNVTATICVKAPTEQEATEIAEQVKIELEQVGKTLTVKTRKPRLKRKRSISISYHIAVPEQTTLQLESNVGEIKVSNIAAPIQAEANIGEITCKEIAGDTNLKTNIGEVTVVYSKTTPPACNAAISVNIGEINFAGPPDLSAEVHISANIGSIKTNLPITVTGKIGKKLHGTIGKGQGKVSLKTNVGSIRIR